MPSVGGGKRDGRAASKLSALLLGIVLFIPLLVVEARLQQKQGFVHDSHHDVLIAPDKGVVSKLEATRLSSAEDKHAQGFETIRSQRSKTTLSNSSKNDASAIATLAPVAPTTVGAPVPPGRKSSETAGLSTQQSARSLEDWEVEDFVLLATVDGKLYARDRKTGQERWVVEAEKPMVETTYYRRNRSFTEEDYHRYDDYLWIVEPSRDGSIFLYNPRDPDPGLVNTRLTMKKLVEDMSTYAGDNPPLVYTGEKKTTMVTLDARTGKVLKWFGSSGAIKEESCSNSNGLLGSESDECSTSGTLTLGRIEYTVSIHDKDAGRQIATLKYAEWGPNNFDEDLQRQYRTTLDSKYIYSSHDGGIVGYDHSLSDNAGRRFKQKFSSPVVRVFDIARPWGAETNDPELVALPQPTPPIDDEDIHATDRFNRIFLNHTEDGSWYAMSGVTYPMAVTGLERAQGSNRDWWSQAPMDISDHELSKALVGLHSIDPESEQFLTISAPEEGYPDENLTGNTTIVDSDSSTVTTVVKSLPAICIKILKDFILIPLRDFILSPVWILVIIAVCTLHFSKIAPWSKALIQGLRQLLQILSIPLRVDLVAKPESQVDAAPEEAKEQENANTQIVTTELTPTAATLTEQELQPKLNDPVENTPRPIGDIPQEVVIESPQKEKKKAHRGRRGGVRHKKGKANSEDSLKAKPTLTIDDVVRDARKLGEQPKMEPDVHTINNGVSEVSGPILRMGSLICNTDKLIGTGSNGTMVFEGEFDGRPVAVKRMLIQFFDIASQETKLLRESDDHPNVIRYFAQQSRDGFLYIALELCPASLADVIEKPHLHRDLAQSGEKDLPAVLYQITNGLQHLHSLRIVHRDLKPQNILIAKGKDAKPRLLVSDFGLCKKLEGEQSSFRATTAHAAGTSGWRAPELLLDDDSDQTPAFDTSTHSGSGPLLNGGILPSRRATRAIDIFSLGLVFFYVLTKGCHPFDCGDRYMREVNIRKNIFDLRQLEVLGDYSYEAKDLIASMLEPEPKRRPVAREVMAHPFFWSAKKRLNFLCDVSDHFEKEPRDPPSASLIRLERNAPEVCRGDFLKPLGREFVDSMGKQRKYTGTRLLDLLRALRNKKNHYEDMPDQLKKHVGPLPDGYLSFWTRKFPNLLITCWNIVYEVQWDETDRFRDYYEPANL